MYRSSAFLPKLTRAMQTRTTKPLVVVLGATGTGKSRFAIDLCRKIGGEVVSTDAMQTYRGLDIATNKVNEEEARQCKHHLIGYLDPLEVNSTVINFRDTCLSVIEDIMRRGLVPVIVGGTNYYIEAVLWQFTLDVGVGGANEETEETRQLSNVELHERLMAVDSASANRIHPNDRRKVLHALRVHESSGVALSELLSAQHSASASPERKAAVKSGPLRFKDCVVFRLRCDRAVLNERLDRRTNKMVDFGLIREIESFWKEHNVPQLLESGSVDYTKGIFQSIGLRQFHEYLQLTDAEKQSEKGQTALERGVMLMRNATRQYAKRQDCWVVNRFLKRPGEAVPAVEQVDVTHVEPPKRFYETAITDEERRWEELVDRAVHIIKSCATDSGAHSAQQSADALTLPHLKQQEQPVQVNCSANSDGNARQVEFQLRRCDVCSQVFVVKQVYEEHLRSKKHKRRVLSATKRAERQRSIELKTNNSVTEAQTETDGSAKANADAGDSCSCASDQDDSSNDMCASALYSLESVNANANREKHS